VRLLANLKKSLLRPLGSRPACMGCGTIPAKEGAVTGPGKSLCSECLDEAFIAMKGHGQELVTVRGSNVAAVRCSFCGASGTERGGLATWPDGAICGDCLLLCDEILAEKDA
jgi:hypothetical protein